MKKIIIFLLIILSKQMYSQVVDGITYQAVAVDNNGREIAGQDLNGTILQVKSFNIRFTIIEDSPSGTYSYQEEHLDVLTDNNGLFSIVIGHGTSIGGSYSSILKVKWGEYKHFLKVEIDLKGTGAYKLMGVQQMMAVPYAFHALSSSYSETSGNGIDSVGNNIDGSLTFYFKDGGQLTTDTIIGAQGIPGIDGVKGVNGQNALILTSVEAAGVNCGE